MKGTLETYNRQLEEMQAELFEAQEGLANAKFGKRAKFRKIMRSLKTQIRRQQKLIKETQNEIRKVGSTAVRQTLAEQGIDSRGNIATSIASNIGQLGASAISTFAPGRRNKDVDNEEVSQGSSKNTMMLVVGAAALLFFMMKKKK
mgnify:CR=1 FL=1